MIGYDALLDVIKKDSGLRWFLTFYLGLSEESRREFSVALSEEYSVNRFGMAGDEIILLESPDQGLPA